MLEQIAGPLRVSLTSTLVLLAVALLGWYLVSTAIAYNKLRHIPGPPLASFTNWWWIRAAVSGRGHLALKDACDRYGSIARISPNMVVTWDLDLYRKANAHRINDYTRGKWYKAFKMDAERENLFTQLDDEKHSLMRAKLSPGYSGKDNPECEPSIDQMVMDVVHLIKRKYLSVGTSFKPLDWAELAQYFTLDVITYLSLGEPFGFVANDTDKYTYVKSMEDNFPIMNVFSAVPLLSAIARIPTVQANLVPSPKEKTGLGKVKAVARQIIADRFSSSAASEKSTRHDMVTSFKNHGLSELEISDESLFQLLAGSDTTATIVRTGFLSILSNPHVYRKLQAEALATDIPLDTIIPYAQALRLPYLQACIKEALRHHPAAAGLLPRVVGPHGDTHKGVYLPPGTEVAFCAWNMLRHNTVVFGEDAEVFRPERWLEASGERLAAMEDAHHLVFGNGRFRCMGENIARLELNKIFFEMIRRFDWSLVDPIVPIKKNTNYGLFVQKGMFVRVSELEG
ncbi:hypothetical protein G647_08675 [Cladophialophora carrionii CBS 160.54]|uniref:Pisatin demethylase n=1 Tax=Cladophialophora carrionii CBS 160.54 TaxID=1279043 RepID=V9D056_9EURO|nr:uncharacterized protein G647_08675 [Cladophialophora carrionii CBS 160.54]ETI19663.1 hypothetical protein G647_08675 [Cladophialophora carrionii CBS 160.54]